MLLHTHIFPANFCGYVHSHPEKLFYYVLFHSLSIYAATYTLIPFQFMRLHTIIHFQFKLLHTLITRRIMFQDTLLFPVSVCGYIPHFLSIYVATYTFFPCQFMRLYIHTHPVNLFCNINSFSFFCYIEFHYLSVYVDTYNHSH